MQLNVGSGSWLSSMFPYCLEYANTLHKGITMLHEIQFYKPTSDSQKWLHKVQGFRDTIFFFFFFCLNYFCYNAIVLFHLSFRQRYYHGNKKMYVHSDAVLSKYWSTLIHVLWCYVIILSHFLLFQEIYFLNITSAYFTEKG